MEELLEFAKWVAKEVCIPDDEWKNNFWAFQEIACRRLVKLGIIQEHEGGYIYEAEDGI